MKSLEEIRNTSTYQNADDAGKALIEQEYNKRYGKQGDATISNNDRLAGQAQNLAQDVQNIQNPNYDNLKEVPDALPLTQNIKTDAAPNDTPSKSWDQIYNTNVYKNASDQDKYAIRKEYEKRGGVIEESNPGILRSAKTAGLGSYYSVRDLASNLVYGTGVLASNVLNKTDGVLNSIIGQDPNNSMLSNWTKESSQYLQNSLNDLNQGAAVQANAEGVSTTEAGKEAYQYAAPVAEGAAIMLTGGLAGAPLAFMHGGAHYANTPDENKSIATSLTVGGIQQLANEALPGSGGRVASAVESSVSKFFSPVASPTVNRVLSRIAGKSVGLGESSTIGYAGGYGVGAGTALAEGKTFEEAHEQGLESGKEGAAMGLGFHGAGTAIKYASKPKTSSVAPKAFNQKIEDQTADIDSTLNAPGSERRAAFEGATERNTQAAHNIVEEAGLKSTQQTIKAGGLGEPAGVTEKAGDKAFADLEGVKQNYQDTVDTFKQSTQATNSRNVEDVINAVKPKVGDEANTTENKKSNEAVSIWQRAAKKRLSEQNKTNINYEKLNDLAQNEHDAFLNMPKDAQDFVKSNWETPFSNNTQGYDPIAHANEHIATDIYLDNVGTRVKNASDINDPSRLSKALKVMIPVSAHGMLFHHGGGIIEHAALAGGEAGLGAMYSYGKGKLNQRKTTKQREAQLAAGKEATANINRAQGTVKTAHEALETPVTEEAYREQRNNREQASILRKKEQRDAEKAQTLKQDFAGHEELQNQITPQNYNDKELISNLRSKLSQRKASAKAEEKQSKREEANRQAAHINATQIKEYKQANPHLKNFFSEATNNLKNAGKDITLANFNKEVMNQVKKSKTTFNAGSKDEYYQDVKDQFAPEPARAEQRAAIDAYFSDKSKLNKDGVLKREEQVKLHKSLAEIARNHFGKGASEEQSNISEYWNKKSERTNKRDELDRLSQQSDEVAETIKDALKDSGLSERKSNRFTKAKMQELNSKGVMNRAEIDSYISQIKQDAESLKKGETIKSKSSESSTVFKVKPGEEATWKNKDFDMPVKVIKHQEDGFTVVRPAILDKEGKITGYGNERYLPTDEIVKSKVTTTSTKSESTTSYKLTDTENNNIRNKYMSEIADSVGTDNFHKNLDEFEAFIEEHDLTDTSTSKKYHNWIETLAKINERKAQGITDPELLISSKEWTDSVAPGTPLGSYLRHAVGKGGNWTPSLHTTERAAGVKRKQVKSLRKTPKAKKLNLSR